MNIVLKIITQICEIIKNKTFNIKITFKILKIS